MAKHSRGLVAEFKWSAESGSLASRIAGCRRSRVRLGEWRVRRGKSVADRPKD
jgi:hypothetical protein